MLLYLQPFTNIIHYLQKVTYKIISRNYFGEQSIICPLKLKYLDASFVLFFPLKMSLRSCLHETLKVKYAKRSGSLFCFKEYFLICKEHLL